jgi:hypothetical protein
MGKGRQSIQAATDVFEHSAESFSRPASLNLRNDKLKKKESDDHEFQRERRHNVAY